MTRKSERELERTVEDLDRGGRVETPMTIRIRCTRVDETGTVVEQLPERVIEHEHCGPNLVIKRTVVETGWEPDR